MTPEQKAFYEKELASIRRNSIPSDQFFVVDCIGGLGSYNLGPVDPPVIGIACDDPHYTMYLQSWDDVNAYIRQLTEQAEKAWGKQ